MKFNEFSNEPLSEGILDVFRKKAPKQNEEITSEDLEFIKQYFPSAYGLKQYSAAEADLNIWHKGKGVDIAFLKRNGKLYASVSHLTSDGKRTVVSSLHDVSTPDKMKLLSQESYKELGFVDHKEIDEGWKHWVGGAALAGALGAGIAATPVAYVDGVRYDRGIGEPPATAKVVTADDGQKIAVWVSKSAKNSPGNTQGHKLYKPIK